MVELAIALRVRRATTISIALTIEREMKGRRNTKKNGNFTWSNKEKN